MYRMESMLRSGSAPFIPAGAAHLIIDVAPTKHPLPCCKYFPIDVFTFSTAWCGTSCRLFLSHGFSAISRVSGHGLRFEHLVTQKIRRMQPPPIREHSGLSDADYGDLSCQELSATTCLF